jgi:ElaB/YqjD/DUF883 family membrane-anchored ribosome-binding protein
MREFSMTDTVEHRMAKDLAQGYDDVVRGLDRMTRHLGADAAEAVAQSAASFVRAASDLAEQLKKQAEGLARKTGEEVREHPVAAAALAAAAVGLLGYAVTHQRASPPKSKA